MGAYQKKIGVSRQPWIAGLALALLPAAAMAQEAPLALADAIGRADTAYPATRVTRERLSAAAMAIELARTSYLPRVDFLAQVNRATRNNVFGMILPQSTLPGISGPPLPTNSLTSAWGSAVGLLVSWEPFDFGLRQARVDEAEADRRHAEAADARTRFEVETAVADTFLTVLAAEETTKAAQAGVERAKVLLETVQALVRAELRAGADESRARAELAVAETQLVRARQAVETGKATLAQFLDTSPAGLRLEPGRLLETPPEMVFDPEGASGHPMLVEQRRAVEQVEAARQTLDRSYYPKFNLQGASYARGTGVEPDGSTLTGVHGLGPNIHNWGVGFTVTFPVLDLPAVRAKKAIERHRQQSEEARYQQMRQDLLGDFRRATADLEAAREVAKNTPVQLEAARAAEQQIAARYRAGLSTVLELADAQRLLTQAEIDDSLARLGVWRALLRLAAVEGDLEPFVRQAQR
jgi:outer membrane protein